LSRFFHLQTRGIRTKVSVGMSKLDAMKNEQFLQLLRAALPQLEAAFAVEGGGNPPRRFVSAMGQRGSVEQPESADSLAEGTDVLRRVAERMGNNYPYFHPLYAGQMLKPPHPIARAAYAMAMGLNPNNHALDGGRASSRMEVEAVAAIAGMFGLKQHLGHLTSSGTFANLEALWVAGQLAPGTILASDQAHYTHGRISAVLKLEFEPVASDSSGAMDMQALEARLAQGTSGDRQRVDTVVATLGTTATGSVDPLAAILALRDRYGFRVHVDAAYGGYFTLSSTLQTNTRISFDAIAEADSIVIDPHKHGLQPYGCGCVLFRDPAVGRLYKHDSPYTYFSSAELHLGEISLECSRAGASAVALWATQELLPMVRGGRFAQDLDRCRAAALELYRRVGEDGDFVAAFAPELDIVVWAVRGTSVEESSARAQAVFDEAARRNLHLALAVLPTRFFPVGTWPDAAAEGSVRCLRSVLMKPDHIAWMREILSLLDASKQSVLNGE
jgi:tyrosine decarboxylase/aspartate 1-decarboxylase